MSTLQKVVAANIRKRRLELGLTQEKLAELADMHHNYISMVERCHRNITIISLEKVAAALRVEPAQLLIAPARR